MVLRQTVLAAVLAGCASAAGAREVRTLSGAGWTLDGKAVVVPHMWDAETAANPTVPCIRRIGRYVRELPPLDVGRRWFVRPWSARHQ